MLRSRVRRSVTIALATAGLAAGSLAVHSSAQAAYEDATMNLPRKTSPYGDVGPHRPFVQEILIGGVVPMKNEAIVNRTKHGYIFRAGQQDTDLTMTYADGRLRFVDKGTLRWKWLPRACKRLNVPQGVGASCAIGKKFTNAAPMLVEVWPRLGDDVVDARGLPALFDVSFLGDKGEDVVYFGAGDNFFNGAQDADRAYGGDGNDWIRTGLADDFIDGGAGDDYLAGVDGNDTIYGGAGDDRIFGLNGNDTIFAGPGRDHVNCGNGTDKATVKSTDRTISCESTSRY